jgi:hypothetical protein
MTICHPEAIIMLDIRILVLDPQKLHILFQAFCVITYKRIGYSVHRTDLLTVISSIYWWSDRIIHLHSCQYVGNVLVLDHIPVFGGAGRLCTALPAQRR